MRGGHFSILSKSPITGLYPAYAPVSGYAASRPLGMAAFSQRHREGCWLSGLRTTLDMGIPVIVLMHYGPRPQLDDGHFRVVVGYKTGVDENISSVLLYDPWDREWDGRPDDLLVRREDRERAFARDTRSPGHAWTGEMEWHRHRDDGDQRREFERELQALLSRSARNTPTFSLSEHRPLFHRTAQHGRAPFKPALPYPVSLPQPRVVEMSTGQFCSLWNYTEYNGNISYDAYFGAIALPWEVTIEFWEEADTSQLSIAVSFSYPCPPAFQPPSTVNLTAMDTTLYIDLPSSLALNPSNTSSTHIGTMQPGESRRMYVLATSDDALRKPSEPTSIVVAVYGYIHASVPYVYWGNGTYIDGYAYTDLVGGMAKVGY